MRLFHRKNNRLCTEKEIGALFSYGSVNFVHPIKAIYFIKRDNELFYKVLVSVSKRNFKKAVDRNLIKRRIKEATRKNIQQISKLLETKGVSINIAFVYVSKHIPTSEEIEETVVRHILYLTNRIETLEQNEN
jgi:ribonuclease P protein component